MAEDESVIIKPREPFSDAILPQNADELAKFMDRPMAAIAESITGALAAGPKEWTVMAGRIVQGILKGKMYQQISREIKLLRGKGAIPDDYADEKKYKYGGQSWVELLAIIDDEAPDADRLEALKAMFFAVNKVGIKDAERILNYQLFQIAKRVNSGELLLLKGIYECHQAGHMQGPIRHNWANHMVEHMGHNVVGLFRKDVRKLLEQGLVFATTPDTGYAVVDPGNVVLTDLGMSFCEHIREYQLETSGAG